MFLSVLKKKVFFSAVTFVVLKIKKTFFFFNTKKVTAEKPKIWPFLVNLSENSSMCRRNHLTVIGETNSSHLINAVCDMLHQ